MIFSESGLRLYNVSPRIGATISLVSEGSGNASTYYAANVQDEYEADALSPCGG